MSYDCGVCNRMEFSLECQLEVLRVHLKSVLQYEDDAKKQKASLEAQIRNVEHLISILQVPRPSADRLLAVKPENSARSVD